jgi:hypothetical protein
MADLAFIDKGLVSKINTNFLINCQSTLKKSILFLVEIDFAGKKSLFGLVFVHARPGCYLAVRDVPKGIPDDI